MNNIFQQLFKPRPLETQELHYHPTPDPEEMLATGLSGTEYQGRMVDWVLTIENMYNDFDPNEILVLTSFRSGSVNIWLSVLAEANPEIYDHGSGSQINVKGKVKTIQGKNIYLDRCQLQFS